MQSLSLSSFFFFFFYPFQFVSIYLFFPIVPPSHAVTQFSLVSSALFSLSLFRFSPHGVINVMQSTFSHIFGASQCVCFVFLPVVNLSHAVSRFSLISSPSSSCFTPSFFSLYGCGRTDYCRHLFFHFCRRLAVFVLVDPKSNQFEKLGHIPKQLTPTSTHYWQSFRTGCEHILA